MYNPRFKVDCKNLDILEIKTLNKFYQFIIAKKPDRTPVSKSKSEKRIIKNIEETCFRLKKYQIIEKEQKLHKYFRVLDPKKLRFSQVIYKLTENIIKNLEIIEIIVEISDIKIKLKPRKAS